VKGVSVGAERKQPVPRREIVLLPVSMILLKSAFENPGKTVKCVGVISLSTALLEPQENNTEQVLDLH
jgi:hypothetical protein